MVSPHLSLESAPWQIKLIHPNLPRHQLVQQRLEQPLQYGPLSPAQITFIDSLKLGAQFLDGALAYPPPNHDPALPPLRRNMPPCKRTFSLSARRSLA